MLLRHIFTPLLASWLRKAGCCPILKLDVPAAGRMVRRAYNTQLRRGGIPFRCVRLELEEQALNELAGRARLSDGRVLPVAVTIGERGEMSWRVLPF